VNLDFVKPIDTFEEKPEAEQAAQAIKNDG